MWAFAEKNIFKKIEMVKNMTSFDNIVGLSRITAAWNGIEYSAHAAPFLAPQVSV